MKLLGFAGSPRVGGNSDVLLDEVLSGAVAAGAEVEKICLNKLSIRPCQACEGCRKEQRRCVVQDDMQALYDKLNAADAWVLATPVYWWGPSAQLKLMVDRWYGMPDKRQNLPGKRVGLVVTLGDDDHKTAQPTLQMFRDAFDYLHMDLAEPLVVSAMERGEVKGNAAALARARQLGAELVRGK